MKYEAELLAEIIENRGHEKSSIHYESECKEAFIEECKGSYPKLCDYESEWLNYIIENPIGEFPYETITNVTEATVNNVVPFAFKSAILKGNTLVNITKNTNTQFTLTHNQGMDIDVSFIPKGVLCSLVAKVSENTLLSNKISVSEWNNNLWIRSNWFNNFSLGVNVKTFTFGTDVSLLKLGMSSGASDTSNQKITFDYFMIIVGDISNMASIPYFEGMQSVKMPVLTTTTSKNLSSVPFSFFEKTTDRTYASWNIYEFDNLFSGKIILNKMPINNIMYYDSKENKMSIGTVDVKDVQFIGFYNPSTNIIKNNKGNLLELLESGELDISLQENGKTNVYSYKKNDKTNILTVNEDVTLRGIGDVQDTLDCLTGELTQYFDEVTFDGSDDEKFIYQSAYSKNDIALFEWKNYFDYTLEDLKRQGNMISDKFSVNPSYLNPTKEGVYCQFKHINVMIEKSKLSELTTLGIQTYLKQNPIKMILPKQNTVKTVDLNVVNQDGNTLSKIKPIEGTMYMKTDGQPLKPLLSAEVPVEAITQNLASFINEE